MVLSASSVYSYRENGDSYSVVKRQLMWVAIGLPLAVVAWRMPQRLLRKLVWPGLLLAVLLLALTLGPLGLVRNGQKNWLGIGTIVIQPYEVDKLAVILWASHDYANKRSEEQTYEQQSIM